MDDDWGYPHDYGNPQHSARKMPLTKGDQDLILLVTLPGGSLDVWRKLYGGSLGALEKMGVVSMYESYVLYMMVS